LLSGLLSLFMHLVKKIIGAYAVYLIALLPIMNPFPGQAQINVPLYYQRGKQQLADQEFTQAIQTFNIILQFNPDHAEALFYRGLAKYQLSDYSGAEVDFSLSITIKPYKTEALYYRGLLKI
jgi:tetratricopeptide (TPR) repeat protein